MSHKSIDFGLGPPPAASRNRRESAMKHGRTTSANVPQETFGSGGSPQASAPLFVVADAPNESFGGFDPLAGEGQTRFASSSVSQVGGSNDPFGFFSGSSAAHIGKEGGKEGTKESTDGKTDKNESDDEEGEESEEEESSEEEEEDSDDEDDKKKKKKGKSKEGKKKKGEGDKKKSGKDEAAAAIASIKDEHQKPRGPPLMKVDVLVYMRKGTPFLKYGTSGYPHFRQFQLSEDNTKIVWFSQAKKLKDTQVEIADIDELRLGQTTPNFQRHKAPELSRSSFSVIYRQGRKTLDLIAKDPNEFRIWTDGLKELIRLSRDGKVGELESLKTLVLDIIVHPGRRSSTEIYDVISGLNADAVAPPPTAEEVAASRPRANSSGNKQMYKDVAKNFLALKRKLTKRKDELREQQYYTSAQYDNMQVIVKRVTESINKINEWFQDGEYPLCDDEIWRASVDLESLKNMMKAVKAP